MHLHASTRTALFLTFAVTLPAQHGQQSQNPKLPMYVAPASGEGKEAMKAFQLAKGLEIALVAAEPDLCNGVAFAIDERGRIYVAETFRINDGVFDTRSYMRWKDEDLACRTVEDRLAKYARHIEKDIPKYEQYSERVRLLTDDDNDGIYERSFVFAGGFSKLADGIGSGVLPHDGTVWFTNIPKLWRLQDKDGDHAAEVREAVFDGFGVHSSLIGHDLHGLVIGPDRRLWFSIGDRGLNVETKEGKTLAYPNEGAVLRCELDGSNLEVVHRGLRNPQELAFDDYGNLFTGDNNSDGGDRARLVQIVEGGDSGWRIGFQWLKDRGVWNREKMWHPHHTGQPAWIIPPIVNFADGPSGLAFDPGAGLPERYRGSLFLCDFRGGRNYSGIHALRLANKGAGFELVDQQKPIWGILATDCDFGPDGALYVLDWVHGWNKTGKGRIYRVTQEGQRNDMKLRSTARLHQEDFASKTEAQLLGLMSHADRRIRQKAQFELVDREAVGSLLAAARDVDRTLARLHGIWGIGILGRAKPDLLEPLLQLVDDGNADVRAQVARVFGEAGFARSRDALRNRLRDESARVRFRAAIALGLLGPSTEPGKPAKAATEKVVKALLDMLRDNGDRGPLLRHAAVVGLAGNASDARLRGVAGAKDPAVRLGALLALRRNGAAEIAEFLSDSEPFVRAEAARAVFDGHIDAALPALAALLAKPAADDPAVALRALNACRRLGKPEHALAIADFARDESRQIGTRVEAIEILEEWEQPHGQDRVGGNWRPVQHEDAAAAIAAAAELFPSLLESNGRVATAAAKASARLKLEATVPALVRLASSRERPADARTAALRALDRLDAQQIGDVVASIGSEDPVQLRKTAVEIFARRDPAKAAPVLATLCERAVLPERQAAFRALGELESAAAAPILVKWLDDLGQSKVDLGVQLDLLEAAAKRTEPEVKTKLAAIVAAAANPDPMSDYRVCLEGGDARAGRRIFMENAQTQCTRCHFAAGKGGNAGPKLDGIGSRQSRAYLLESLVLPSKQIAEGFATTVVETHNGLIAAGVLVKDQDGALEVMTIDGEVKQIAWGDIKSRKQSTESAMPIMAGTLTKRQLRDVVAFLAGLK